MKLGEAWRRALAATVAIATLSGLCGLAIAAKGDTILVSRASNGDVADDDSFQASISANGRFIAFRSGATNLSNRDADAFEDIFVHDRKRKRTELVSVRSNGGAANGGSFSPSISAGGRFVSFTSEATNLSGADDADDLVTDVFVRDRKTDKTTLISRRSNGGDGGNASSRESHISANGRFVAFGSDATNLSGADDPTGDVGDVFLHDRKKGRTELVSRRSNGGPGGNDDSGDDLSLSSDGRYVAFESEATNLSNVDLDAADDVFVMDRKRKKLRLVSRLPGGGPAGDDDSQDPAISATGRFVAFESDATNFSGADEDATQDIFVSRLAGGKIRLASRSNSGDGGNDDSLSPAISDDGRHVVFISRATNLSNADEDIQDIHAFNLRRGRITLVSRSSAGVASNASSRFPEISASGRHVTYSSDATNLTGPGNDSVEDIFRFQLLGP